MVKYKKRLMLTDREYRILMTHFCQEMFTYEQTNYYFDTPYFDMEEANNACCIRERNGNYEAIITEPKADAIDGFIETEVDIGHGIHDNAFTRKNLYYMGNMLIQRTPLIKNRFCEMAMDRNAYLCTVDHELIIEYLPEYKHYADRFLELAYSLLCWYEGYNNLDSWVNRVKTSENKMSRFFFQKKRLIFK